VADVLSDLARENIIHRDLKLENIMLIREEGDPDFVKLLDFGIARIQTFSHLTESGTVLGTLPYMPPEVVSDRTLSPAVDIYSLGVIAYKLLTRTEPIKGEKPLDTMRQIVNKIPPPPIELNPEISPQLNHLILKMIEKRPELRPTAQQVIEELRKLKY
jgi:serine/threonine-protein kinase